MSSALVIILVGCCVAASCALVGSFLVLRKMALLGDAISHAVLPGIAIAFLLTGSRAALPMMLGASAVGVLTVFCVEALSRSRRLYEDASIGVVFPALFSIGVILVSGYTEHVDLDVECVLYGEIGLAALDTLVISGVALGPRPLWITGGVLLIDLILVLGLYKELKVASFDPDLAGSLGFSPVFLHYLLMAAVSVTVVASFESVGSILVVAMLVVPPATAYLFTDKLSWMLVLAVLIGMASSVAGYWTARGLDCQIAGAMATVAGAFFVTGLLASPRHGLVSRVFGQRRLAQGLNEQLLLLHLKGTAGPGAAAPLLLGDVEARFGWRRARVERAVRRLAGRGLVESSGDKLRITLEGEAAIETGGFAALAHPIMPPT